MSWKDVEAPVGVWRRIDVEVCATVSRSNETCGLATSGPRLPASWPATCHASCSWLVSISLVTGLLVRKSVSGTPCWRGSVALLAGRSVGDLLRNTETSLRSSLG